MYSNSGRDFAVLKGKTITEITGLEEDSDVVNFLCDDGTKFSMYHSQDCCEHVRIVDVVGDVQDLIGSEILVAEEAVNDPPEGVDFSDDRNMYNDSATWTFYKLATRKGYVDIRWLGESNGYYSESVDFKEITNG